MKKRIRSKIVRVLFSAFAVLFSNVLIAGDDKGEKDQQCSNATLHGSYGFHATGTGFVAIGRFVFDGNGGLTGKLFIRRPGTNIGPLEFTGTYSVAQDCTVTDTWGPPINSTHVSVIFDEGKGYFIMNVSPSTAAEDTLNNGAGRRQ